MSTTCLWILLFGLRVPYYRRCRKLLKLLHQSETKKAAVMRILVFFSVNFGVKTTGYLHTLMNN